MAGIFRTFAPVSGNFTGVSAQYFSLWGGPATNFCSHLSKEFNRDLLAHWAPTLRDCNIFASPQASKCFLKLCIRPQVTFLNFVNLLDQRLGFIYLRWKMMGVVRGSNAETNCVYCLVFPNHVCVQDTVGSFYFRVGSLK